MYQHTGGRGQWSSLAVLTGSTVSGDLYGSSLAMVHDAATGVLTLAVGAPGAASTAGFVWIHKYQDAVWSEGQQLTSDTEGSFGASLALLGNMLVVGESALSTNNGRTCELNCDTPCSVVF